MTRWPWLLMALLLLAGCAAPAPMPGPAQAPAPPAAPAEPFAMAWALPSCRYLRLTMDQDRDSAAQGLPPDYQLEGEGVATLVLLLADCPAAVLGNVTVIHPFRYAVTYHLLKPLSDQSNQVDTFAREVIVEDPAAAVALGQVGLPVHVGQVTLSAPGAPYALHVSAPGIDYAASGAAQAVPPGPDSSDFRFCYRLADDRHAVWLQDEVHRASRSNLPAAVAAQAAAGYLATALPAGTTVARIEESTGSATWSLHEQVFA